MRRYVLSVILVVAVAVAWVLVLPARPIAQPIAFNHQRHSAVGCAVCHDGVTRGARAGIPQSEVCVRCHATAPALGTGAISEETWKGFASGHQIAWKQINRLPDHVMFSHRRHTGPGQLACASCHGDMKQRTTPPDRPATRLVMKTCLSCHQREGASEDCAGCHR